MLSFHNFIIVRPTDQYVLAYHVVCIMVGAVLALTPVILCNVSYLCVNISYICDN